MKLTARDKPGVYSVRAGGRDLGTVELYDNPVHGQNCYVKLALTQWEPSVAGELFQKLASIAERPLQVMADSEDTNLTDFLLAGGFRCVRKCYEAEVSAEDYIGPGGEGAPLSAPADGEDAARCRRILYDHYRETHRSINPWTADFDTFCRELPQEVFCRKTEGAITALAFVEENEIAYILAADKAAFLPFAASLLAWMFGRYETVCFESDDCDWAAMELRALFKNQSEDSYDTYIYCK